MYTRIFFLLFSFHLQATIGNGDFQVWLDNHVRQPLLAGVTFLGEVHHRFDENASRFFYWHMQGLAAYRGKNLEVALGYRQAYVHNRRPFWNSRYGTILDATLFTSFRKWDASVRYRMQHINDAAIRTANFVHRGRFWLSRAVAKCLNVVIEEEFFYHDEEQFNQNRVTLGLLFTPEGNIALRTFYRLRYSKSSSIWTYQNVFGFYAAYDF